MIGRAATAVFSSRVLAWIVAALVAGTVAWLSLVPHPEEIVPPLAGLWDKLQHVIAYVGVSSSLCHALFVSSRPGDARLRRAALWACAVATALGALLEVLQNLAPTRTPDPEDALANAVGSAIGVLLYVAGRTLSLRVFRPVAVVAAIALACLNGVGCAGSEARDDAPEQAIRPIESFIREQARLRRTHDDHDLQGFYDALVERSSGAERAIYGCLRARLEKVRPIRRARLEALAAIPLAEATLELGDMAFEDGDRARALGFWDRADPESPRTVARRAWLLSDAAMAGRALDAHERAAEPVPDGFVAGAAWLAKGPARAQAVLDEAEALGLEDATGALVRGLLRFLKGLLAPPVSLKMTETELRHRLANLAGDDELPRSVREALADALGRTLTTANLNRLITIARECLAGLEDARSAVTAIEAITHQPNPCTFRPFT